MGHAAFDLLLLGVSWQVSLLISALKDAGKCGNKINILVHSHCSYFMTDCFHVCMQDGQLTDSLILDMEMCCSDGDDKGNLG